MPLANRDEGWEKYYYFYDHLFRSMLESEFAKDGAVLKPDEVDDLMQMLWMKHTQLMREFKVQDEADLIVVSNNMNADDLSSSL